MKRKIIVRIIIVLGVLLTGLAGLGSYMYNKPHRNIGKAKPDFVITSATLYNSFSQDENYANSQFLDKVILLKGRIMEVMNIRENDVVILLEGEEGVGGVSCTLNSTEISKAASLKKNQELTIKGRCTGMLMEVVLVDCFIQ
jgi:hypothetical protein